LDQAASRGNEENRRGGKLGETVGNVEKHKQGREEKFKNWKWPVKTRFFYVATKATCEERGGRDIPNWK